MSENNSKLSYTGDVLITASVKCRNIKSDMNSEYEQTGVFSKEESIESVFEWAFSEVKHATSSNEVCLTMTGRTPKNQSEK